MVGVPGRHSPRLALLSKLNVRNKKDVPAFCRSLYQLRHERNPCGIVAAMNNEAVQIRKAIQSDLVDVATCARAAYAQYVDAMGKEPAPMNADFARQIEQGVVYIAHYQDRFAGYVVFYADGADHVHLENVAVLPEMCGKGVGKSLIDYAEQSARQCGAKRVELYTNEAMTANLGMYPKLGYVEISRKLQAGFHRVFFRKDL